MDFPYLQEKEIEHKAAQLLWNFEQEFGQIIGYQTPIEEIAENHLGLITEIMENDDEDILGSLNIQDKVISINEAIYPEDIDVKAGRYRFTLGHEVAHWVLHAPIVLESLATPLLFDLDNKQDLQNNHIIMCRGKSKDMIEWQADYFSGALLVPSYLVKKQWELYTGKKQPLLLSRVAASITTRARKTVTEQTAVELWAKPLAQVFNVSAQAMVVRLKQIGLLAEDHYNREFSF